MKLADKVAIITGGSTGVGKATAMLFAEEGAKVVITGRREELLEACAQEAKRKGIEIDYLRSDVSKVDDCREAVEYVRNKYSRIDILFNNAGIIVRKTTHEIPLSVWEEMFDINVRGVFLMSKFTLPYMLEQEYGVIVNNNSILGLKASPGSPVYNATKGAITQLTRSMALEYADKGIRVNAVCPGGVYTPMVDKILNEMGEREAAEERYKSVHPAKRLAQPEEIAHAVLFLCDDSVKFMTGSMLSVDGGLIAK